MGVAIVTITGYLFVTQHLAHLPTSNTVDFVIKFIKISIYSKELS